MDPKLSVGEGGSKLTGETATLLEHGWSLDKEHMGVKKTYYFKTYTKCVDFFLSIRIKSNRTKRYCDGTITYSSVHIHWKSAEDVFMAHYSDAKAKSIGTVDENETRKCTPAQTSKSSSGGDQSELRTDVDALLAIGWSLDEKQMGVQRTYHFADPTECQDCFTSIAIKSKGENHHSVMTVKSTSLYIYWTTHSLPGLSKKDIFMAQFSDEEAGSIGTVDEVQTQKHTAARTSQI